mgnify:CR=1 FL=1
MSETTENISDTQPAITASADAVVAPYNVIARCTREKYRRAGYPMVRGENTLLRVSDEALAILQADPVLAVRIIDEDGVVSATPVSAGAEARRLDVLDMVGVEDNDALYARIRDAVSAFGAGDYTQAGAPRVNAVREALGVDVTAEQIAAAMAATDSPAADTQPVATDSAATDTPPAAGSAE